MQDRIRIHPQYIQKKKKKSSIREQKKKKHHNKKKASNLTEKIKTHGKGVNN